MLELQGQIEFKKLADYDAAVTGNILDFKKEAQK